MTGAGPLIQVNAVTAGFPGAPPLFTNLTWALHAGETWAITGPAGSGKTAFGRLIRGRLPVRCGHIAWPGTLQPDTMRTVGFQADSRLLKGREHFYQERFHASDPHTTPTVHEYLADGSAAPARVQHWAATLDLTPHLEARILTLSTGQLRRAQLARALAADPKLLILDHPFTGLDATTRPVLADRIGHIISAGTPVLLLAPPGPLPAWVTHALTLPAPAPAPPTSNPLPLPAPPRGLFGKPVIQFHTVTVRHAGRTILDAITWTVRAGERWAISGPNGAGKSTLLALVAGDHPRAFAESVTVFGHRRGELTLAEWRDRIGFVSGELHHYFREPLTLRQAAATGFTGHLVPRRLTPDEAIHLDQLLAEFRLTDVAARLFSTLSASQQRLGLIVRALVRRPPLVILDEPFQPLDATAADHVRTWLDTRLTANQTLLFVTHIATERPRTLSHELRLHAGRVVTN